MDLIKHGDFNILQHLLLVRHRQPLDNVGKDALAGLALTAEAALTKLWRVERRLLRGISQEARWSSAWIVKLNEAWDDLVGDVFRRFIEHFFKLLRWEALNDDILLLLTELVFFLEAIQLRLHVGAVGTEASAVKTVDVDVLALD